MDVVKTKKKSNPLLNSKYQIALAIFTSLVFLALWANQSVGSISVERNDILVEKVHKGDLEVSIEGYGSLKSDKQQLITTLTRATVKEIILKPGASVKADSVIVRLENPELQQLVDNAQQELAQTTANLRQLKLNNQRETLL